MSNLKPPLLTDKVVSEVNVRTMGMQFGHVTLRIAHGRVDVFEVLWSLKVNDIPGPGRV